MRSRGAAMILALGLMVLVSAVLAGSMQLIRTDAEQTAAEITAGQLTHLLLAGEASAADELTRTGRITAREIATPIDAQLSLRPTAGATAVITARLLGQTREQTVEYAREGGRWTLRRATLD